MTPSHVYRGAHSLTPKAKMPKTHCHWSTILTDRANCSEEEELLILHLRYPESVVRANPYSGSRHIEWYRTPCITLPPLPTAGARCLARDWTTPVWRMRRTSRYCDWGLEKFLVWGQTYGHTTSTFLVGRLIAYTTLAYRSNRSPR